jgi:hypothetical protein
MIQCSVLDILQYHRSQDRKEDMFLVAVDCLFIAYFYVNNLTSGDVIVPTCPISKVNIGTQPRGLQKTLTLDDSQP